MDKKQNQSKQQIIQRTMGAVICRAGDEEKSRRRFTISFSSEEPYRRYFGPEILDHTEGAVNLERLNSVGVLLFNHNRDRVLGKVLRAWVEDRRGMAEVEFDEDDFAAMIRDKVAGGTLKTTSVAYTVDSWEEIKAGASSADGRFAGPCMVARKWIPMEVSIVSVPADSTVGVGRSETEADEEAEDKIDKTADECFDQRSLCEYQLQINKNLTGGKI